MISLPAGVRPALLTLVFGAQVVAAQETVRVAVEENFRRAPNGELLARLEPGTPLTVVSRDGQWTQVDLDGWVWLRSLQASSSANFDLVVSQGGGENLRNGPGGDVLGRVQQGMLLQELGREPSWVQVRRRGWIWSQSIRTTAPAPIEVVAAPPASREPGGFVRVAAAGILSSPDGDTLATTSAGTDVQVIAREGNWARVRLEGWAWVPESDGASEAPGQQATGVTPADVSADPVGHRGRVIAWTLQFISLERAERVRTDFFEGEPFLLARFGDADGPFVYVAVPPERIAEAEGLAPLEQVAVTGRIRTGASALTGTPIVDLISLERLRDRE